MAKYQGKFLQARQNSRPSMPRPVQPEEIREELPVRKQKKPRRKGGGVVIAVLLVLFAGLIGFSGWKLLQTRQEYDAGTDAYAALSAAVVQKPVAAKPQNAVTQVEMEQVPSQSETAEPEETPVQSDEPTPWVVDFTLLSQLNRDTVGWISSEGTGIDYPVVQGTDNEYYLDHLFDGTANRNGAIFVDCRNTPGFVDRNTFIYGHNMLNGAMFASLSQYGTAGYYEAHPEFVLATPSGSYCLQVFSGYVTPGDSDIYQLTFRDDADFGSYLERIRLLSDFATNVTVTETDRIVTLSTCTYDYEEARYVVHCKLVPMQ